VECAVAGHLPILRVRNSVVEEVTTPELAVGMIEGSTFKTADRFVVERMGESLAGSNCMSQI